MANKRLKKKKTSNKSSEVNEDGIKNENGSTTETKNLNIKRKINPDLNDGPPGKKRKNKKDVVIKSIEAQEELDPIKPKIKTQESKRSRKRKLHATLMQEKKLESDIKLQEKCLNYLSKWKHSKSEWKFQKNNQTWLFRNLYDEVKIPKQFWETTLDYFNSSQGKIRKEMLDKAKKIIDEQGEEDEKTDVTEEDIQEEDVKEEKDAKNLVFQRAKDVIQNIYE